MTAVTSYAAIHKGEPKGSVECAQGGALVWLRSEHDRATRATLSEAIGASVTLGRGDLVIDLSGVTFMDASTVGVIVDARTGLRYRDRDLVLRDPSSCARRLIELCGLTDLLERPRKAVAAARSSNALGSWVVVPTPANGPVPLHPVAPDGRVP
jgi:anti-sigma B factor antagonist